MDHVMTDPTTVWPRVRARLDELTAVLGGIPVADLTPREVAMLQTTAYLAYGLALADVAEAVPQ